MGGQSVGRSVLPISHPQVRCAHQRRDLLLRDAIKYLYKHVFKGNDRALAAIAQPEEATGEITNFVEARYLGSCEQAWSIVAFPTTERFPTVLHLALHEPGGQNI